MEATEQVQCVDANYWHKKQFLAWFLVTSIYLARSLPCRFLLGTIHLGRPQSWGLLTPSPPCPHSATDFYYKIHATSLSRFLRTSYVDGPLEPFACRYSKRRRDNVRVRIRLVFGRSQAGMEQLDAYLSGQASFASQFSTLHW